VDPFFSKIKAGWRRENIMKSRKGGWIAEERWGGGRGKQKPLSFRNFTLNITFLKPQNM